MVRFHIYREEDDHHSRLSFAEKVHVYDPSDCDCYPEAFDANRILQHMRECHNLCKYAEILDCLHPEDLQRDIDKILYIIPGRGTSQSHCPTLQSLVNKLTQMQTFIEQAVAGLTRKNEVALATKLDEGFDKIKNIMEAFKADQTLHP